jgi:hypothetical protein
MGRPLIILIIVCFAAMALSNSMIMLSLEKGTVYTENFNLPHLLKAASVSPGKASRDRHPTLGSSQFLRHLHVQLTAYYIPEDSDHAVGANMFSPGTVFLPAYQGITPSFAATSFSVQLEHGTVFKFPIPARQQSSVLLI